jgi:uncharacterized protein YhaN
MRLVRIEAERFGGIDGRALGDLSPALTVVVGPNEAGKSSLTTLVRHVLYGFPTQGDVRESPYLSVSGAKRQGRLVFADDDGEWVVERVEGPRGGAVTVRTLSGRPRDGLVEDLTLGVSRAAYRVVFGFGLEEMQQIAQLKGKDDDLLARLYAAGAGLTVSPADIRAKLVERMETLWKPGGSRPRINEARSRREAARKEVRRLESEADTFRVDTERLGEVEERLAEARMERTAAQARSERLGRAVATVSRLLDEAGLGAAKATGLQREAADVRRTAEAAAVDDVALAVAGQVGGLLAELPAFRERIDALAGERSRLAAVDRRLREALDQAGWTEDEALAAAGDAGIAAEIEAARTDLAKLRARADVATEARDRAEAQAAGAGVTGSAAAGPVRAWSLPGFAVAGLGAVGVAAGLALGQTALTVFAAVLAVAGLVLAFVRVPSQVAGGAGTQARTDIATAASAVVAAQRALEERASAWAERVRAWGLGDGGEDPTAVAARLQAARDVRTADRERSAVREVVAREEERVAAFVARVVDVAAPLFGDDPATVTADRCVELVGRAAARLEAASEAGRARTEALAAAERLEREAADLTAASATSAAAAAEELDAVDAAGGGLEDVRRLEAEARIGAADALQAFDALADEAATLRARIAAEGREDDLALLRLEVETLTEGIAADAADYVVLALAARLLSLAQERYERERQPEVVKRAASAFARMTNGRYPRLTVPLGKDAIEVFDESSAASAPDRLSRGTAEQLYLALRLGLVDQLGEVGAGLPVLMDDVLVNFSPDRLRPAAAAVADLAERRQVVFFTCHPDMADLLCSVAPHAVRIELDGPAAGRG